MKEVISVIIAGSQPKPRLSGHLEISIPSWPGNLRAHYLTVKRIIYKITIFLKVPSEFCDLGITFYHFLKFYIPSWVSFRGCAGSLLRHPDFL